MNPFSFVIRSNKIPAAVCLLTAVSFLAACSGAKPRQDIRPSAVQAEPAPVKKDIKETVEEKQIKSALEQIQKNKLDYKVQAGDLLQITVYQEKDMDRLIRVSGNGTISFPLAGTLKIAGRSVPESEEALSKKLGEYIINPQVTIFIKEYGNKQVYVLGEVKKPGSVELPAERKLTVLEAITMSGGFTDLAARDRTKVLRNTEGKSSSIQIDISKITKQGDKSADIVLEPNDVVFVPQSFF